MALSLVGKEEDVAFYARQASKRPGPVLVLGCANGRIAFELAGEEQRVVGVDPSKLMIHSAEERRQHEGIDQERLRFIVDDLRSFRSEARFPLVLAPQNALSLVASLGDLALLLETVRVHLAPGGVFVFDVANPTADDPPAPREHVHEGQPPLLEPPRPPFLPHLRERRRGPSAAQASSIRRLRLRQFEPAELEAALEGAGFKALERLGRFDGKPFEPSDRLQIVVAGCA
ncbi:MAG: class I SAM-dependent DNA methyltransferase [Myxococcaceae bacterium]